MGHLTFNENKQRWHFRFDGIVNGVRRRTSDFLPYGWTRHQALTYATQRELALRDERPAEASRPASGISRSRSP